MAYMMQPRGIEAPDGAGADEHDVDGPVGVGAGAQRLDPNHCAGRGYPSLDSVVTLTVYPSVPPSQAVDQW